MPIVSMTLPDVDQAVSRPIILDVVHQVEALTKIRQDTEIFFPGDIQAMHQSGTTIDDLDRGPKLGNDRRLYIEVEENVNMDGLQNTATYPFEGMPVFRDENLGIVMSPMYSMTDITINFKFRAGSKTEAQRWYNDIRLRVSQMRDINQHVLRYHYLLPIPYLDLLYEIYTKREAVAGYGQRFEEYITSYASDRLTVIGDLVNKDTRLAISETQRKVTGMFGFDAIPEKPERDDALGTWTISFPYKFSYEKPIACAMRYPIFVHNQMLDAKFSTFMNDAPNDDNVNKYYSDTMRSISSFSAEKQLEQHMNIKPHYSLPEYDDFILTDRPRGVSTIFTALCELALPDRKSLFGLDEIDPLVIDPAIMKFIKESEAPYMGQLYRSIFHVGLYKTDKVAFYEAVSVDKNGYMSATKDLNERDINRVHFGMVSDLTLLDPKALERLKNYPDVFVKIISSINEVLRDNPGVQDLGKKNQLTDHDIREIYVYITGEPYKKGSSATQGMTPAQAEDYKRNKIQVNLAMLTNVIAYKSKTI